jgi:GntR family transcriptional regulator
VIQSYTAVLILLDPHSGKPVFRQILEQVRFQVAGGMLKPGDELPSTRQLAADLDLNPMTVSKAYALLEQDGVVERRPGLALVVRAPRGDEQGARRRAELARHLGPAASAARQLGLDVDEALEVFRQALARRGGDDGQQ